MPVSHSPQLFEALEALKTRGIAPAADRSRPTFHELLCRGCAAGTPWSCLLRQVASLQQPHPLAPRPRLAFSPARARYFAVSDGTSTNRVPSFGLSVLGLAHPP